MGACDQFKWIFENPEFRNKFLLHVQILCIEDLAQTLRCDRKLALYTIGLAATPVSSSNHC